MSKIVLKYLTLQTIVCYVTFCYVSIRGAEMALHIEMSCRLSAPIYDEQMSPVVPV